MSDKSTLTRRQERREFMRTVVGKTLYVAPAILTLQCARPLHAGGASCGDAGSPCTTDVDCCSPLACEFMPGTACMGQMTCTCE